MDKQALTNRAEAMLRGHLYGADGVQVRSTCPACNEPVSDVGEHAATCWRLRSGISVGAESTTETPALGSHEAERLDS
jgi:hypothetical protein